MPCLDRQLARNQRRSRAHTVVEHFEQIVVFGRADRGDGEVVDHEQIEPGQMGQTSREAAVAVRDLQFVEQARSARVQHREARAGCLMRQRACQPGFSASC